MRSTAPSKPAAEPVAPSQLAAPPEPVAPPESMIPGAEPRPVEPIEGLDRVVVIGDSYTGGSDAGGYGDANWTELVWKQLEQKGFHIQPVVSGRGGSGYANRGPKGTVFGEEAARLVRPGDDVIMFFGGMNDGMVSPDEVATAAEAAFQSARATAPNAVLLVIGTAWPNAEPPWPVQNLRDVVRDAALAAGGIFVDPLEEGWFSTTPPDLVGSDNIHPTNAGHIYLAQQIEPHIQAALTQAAGG